MIRIDIDSINCCNTCCINIKGNSGTVRISNSRFSDADEEVDSFRLPKDKKLFFDPKDRFIKIRENIDATVLTGEDDRKRTVNYLSMKARLIFYNYINTNYPETLTPLIYQEAEIDIGSKLNSRNTELLTVKEVAKIQRALEEYRGREHTLEKLSNSNSKTPKRSITKLGFIKGNVDKSLESSLESSSSIISSEYLKSRLNSTSTSDTYEVDQGTLYVKDPKILKSIKKYQTRVEQLRLNNYDELSETSLTKKDLKNIKKAMKGIEASQVYERTYSDEDSE